MMNEQLLAFGSKQGMKTQIRDPEYVGRADGNSPNIFCQTNCNPRPWGLSVIRLGCLCSLLMGFLWGCAAPIRQAQPMVEKQSQFVVGGYRARTRGCRLSHAANGVQAEHQVFRAGGRNSKSMTLSKRVSARSLGLQKPCAGGGRP